MKPERLSGVLPVNKIKGIGSFDVIRKIKQILPPEFRKGKIGHGGTLDNLAGGVLLVLFGEATKAFDFLLNSDKIYKAVIKFGAFTETDDSAGKVTESFDKTVSISDIQRIIIKFTGMISQVPPRYSALRINGIRSYDLARDNMEVELKPRNIFISGILIDNFDFENQLLTLTVTCSSGTYIRSIARDMGMELGCGGYIADLTRLKSGGINLEECISMDLLMSKGIDAVKSNIIDLNNAIRLPEIEVNKDEEYIRCGKFLRSDIFVDVPNINGFYKIVMNGRLVAVIEKNKDFYKYLRVFNN